VLDTHLNPMNGVIHAMSVDPVKVGEKLFDYLSKGVAIRPKKTRTLSQRACDL